MEFQKIIFEFLGGLGLFLFCIKYMGDGLQMIAGDRLRSFSRYISYSPNSI